MRCYEEIGCDIELVESEVLYQIKTIYTQMLNRRAALINDLDRFIIEETN